MLGGRGFADWQHDYLNLLAQRDLPAWGLPATAHTTQRLFDLLHALWGVDTAVDLLGHPMVGASWEGHVIDQVLTALQQAGRRFSAHRRFLVNRGPETASSGTATVYDLGRMISYAIESSADARNAV